MGFSDGVTAWEIETAAMVCNDWCLMQPLHIYQEDLARGLLRRRIRDVHWPPLEICNLHTPLKPAIVVRTSQAQHQRLIYCCKSHFRTSLI